jgi:hypothetical protein
MLGHRDQMANLMTFKIGNLLIRLEIIEMRSDLPQNKFLYPPPMKIM